MWMQGNRKIIRTCGVDEKIVKNREEVKQKNNAILVNFVIKAINYNNNNIIN